MPIWLDTRGKSNLGTGVCARCGIKMSLTELLPDPNYPGLRVCSYDRDNLDPYRLPARRQDVIALPFARPDTPLGLNYSAAVPVPVYANQIDGIGTILPAAPWQPNNGYQKGASITPTNIDNQNNLDPQQWLICTGAGTSGSAPPVWPMVAGVPVTDGSVTWLSIDIYPA
jgi:hypothetical protein